MKQITKHDITQAMHDRWWLGLLIVCGVITLGGIISMALRIQPHETQVIMHYSSFGPTGFYRNHWYYLWGYGLLMVIITLAHGVLSLKLRKLERRDLAVALLWGTIGILLLVLLFAHPIIDIAALG